jgi:hypothetical protein
MLLRLAQVLAGRPDPALRHAQAPERQIEVEP